MQNQLLNSYLCFLSSWFIISRGEKMKRSHLFIFSILCFMVTFLIMNTKYDVYYRVKGINNDNRALIELYLDDQEKDYLIEHPVSMHEILPYIEFPDFYLPNYKHYELINRSKIFENKEELIQNTNIIVQRISQNESNTYDYFEQLISHNLVQAYLENTKFDFDYIEYYQILRRIYPSTNYEYIHDCHVYLTVLEGYIEPKQLMSSLDILCQYYDLTSLKTLLTTPLLDTTQIVLDPTRLDLMMDGTNYIGSYIPSDLVIMDGIDRVQYSMHVQKETYDQFKLMYEALRAACGEGLIVSQAYTSYDILDASQSSEAGYHALQLGNSVRLQELYQQPELFSESIFSVWLDQFAYQYGFIKITYGQNIQYSNTYQYVGVELATLLHEQAIDLQTYHQ